MVILAGNLQLPTRLIRKLYKKTSFGTKRGKKWSRMAVNERLDFAVNAKIIVEKHPEIQLFSIAVRKENAQNHTRSDSNKLYNYMMCIFLSDEMAKYENVSLFPDERSIKVESENSLQDYLQSYLWLDLNVGFI